MEERMRGLKKFFLTLLLVLPFVLGMIGFDTVS